MNDIIKTGVLDEIHEYQLKHDGKYPTRKEIFEMAKRIFPDASNVALDLLSFVYSNNTTIGDSD